MPTEDRLAKLRDLYAEQYGLFRAKNHDYGDSFAEHGPVGVLVRLGDKVARMQSVSRTGVNLVADESLRDTLMDLSLYALLAVILLDEGGDGDGSGDD